MARQVFSTECDELERIIHKRNAVCSGRLLAALIEHHSSGDVVPEPEPVPLAPIPNELMAYAADLASPPVIGQIRRIQLAVLEDFPKVTLVDVLSNRRTIKMVWPRQIAMYLSKTLTRQSLPEIGRRFGGRDHSTVHYAVEKIGRLIETDAALADQIERIKGRLGYLS